MFQVEAFYNPYLVPGQNRLDTVLTIRSDSTSAAAVAGGKRVVGFVLDTSGSMKGEKLHQAQMAARRGIEMLDASTSFFVIAFHTEAKVLLSACPADAGNKSLAHHAISQLAAGGGTEMSKGLAAARAEVQKSGAAIASVYFQTDGENMPEDGKALIQTIEACKDVFQCDCRGIGADWHPAQLRMIAEALLGTADAVTDPAGLEADFKAFLSRSLAKGIAGARLRVWSPKVVKMSSFKQVSPDIVDQMALAKRIDDKTLEIPLGAWGTETRDYQISFEMPAGAIGDEILACRAAVIVDGSSGEVKVDCKPVAATWSSDDALTTRISPEVAHYNGQGELASAIQEGLQARAQGDEDKATRLLGRAAQLAANSGNEEVTRRLKKVVDVVDAAAGTVRLRKADKAADMELEMGGTRTVRRRAAPVTAASAAAAPAVQS
jgi:hypothetical protein